MLSACDDSMKRIQKDSTRQSKASSRNFRHYPPSIFVRILFQYAAASIGFHVGQRVASMNSIEMQSPGHISVLLTCSALFHLDLFYISTQLITESTIFFVYGFIGIQSKACRPSSHFYFNLQNTLVCKKLGKWFISLSKQWIWFISKN